MKVKKIKFDKAKIPFGKLPRILGEKAFLTFLGLLVIFLIFGSFLFYKYILIVEKAKPENLDGLPQFNEGFFQEILQKFGERQKKFEETKTKNYPDPFMKTTIIEEELTPAPQREFPAG